MKVTVGIDYSYTSPCVCIHIGDDWSLENCTFYSLNDKKSLQKVENPMFRFSPHATYTNRIQRFSNIAHYYIGILNSFDVSDVAIEGYSMGSRTGAICDISECGGILRYVLHSNGIKFTEYAPSNIKKYATGKGNAKKEALHDSFLEETGIDFRPLFQPRAKNIGNPLSDIIDSYFIAKQHFSNNT